MAPNGVPGDWGDRGRGWLLARESAHGTKSMSNITASELG